MAKPMLPPPVPTPIQELRVRLDEAYNDTDEIDKRHFLGALLDYLEALQSSEPHQL